MSSGKKSRPSLVTALTEQVCKDIAAGSFPSRTTIRLLAASYRVSLVTAWKAARILADQGVLTCRKGKGIEINGAQHHAEGLLQAGKSSRQIICDLITDAIRDGRYRVGSTLPKYDFFVLEHNVSRCTIVKACQQLEKEKWMHKKGKAWVIGSPSQPGSATRKVFNPPVVLILLPNENFWRELCYAARAFQFPARFSHEAQRLGIQVIPVLTGDTVPQSPSMLKSGIDEIGKLIRTLGTRYLGTLIPCGKKHLPDFEPWIDWLSAFNKKVVWFDRDNSGIGHRPSRFFYRCYPSGQNAVQCAVEHLFEAGHRVIGIPEYIYHPWMRERIGYFRSAALKCNPPIEIAVETEDRLFYESAPDKEPFSERLIRLSQRGTPANREIVNHLIRKFPEGIHDPQLQKPLAIEEVPLPLRDHLLPVWVGSVLTPLLRKNSSITAIIAPYDRIGRFIYQWFVASGIAVPAHLTLLSFDNSYEIHPAPVSSIDFGYDTLGYLALHLFLDDIAIKTERNGDVTTEASFVQRGSVGKPREKKLRTVLDGDYR